MIGRQLVLPFIIYNLNLPPISILTSQLSFITYVKLVRFCTESHIIFLGFGIRAVTDFEAVSHVSLGIRLVFLIIKYRNTILKCRQRFLLSLNASLSQLGTGHHGLAGTSLEFWSFDAVFTDGHKLYIQIWIHILTLLIDRLPFSLGFDLKLMTLVSIQSFSRAVWDMRHLVEPDFRRTFTFLIILSL